MNSHRQTGFTLIELMIVVAIIAVIASLGLPSFKRQMQSNDVSSDTNYILGFLSYARSEAVTNKLEVVVCSSSDNSTCAGDADWNKTIIARQSNGTILKLLPATSSSNTLLASASSFTFRTDGSASLGTINICAPSTDVSSRRVAVNGSGQTRSEVFTCP